MFDQQFGYFGKNISMHLMCVVLVTRGTLIQILHCTFEQHFKNVGAWNIKIVSPNLLLANRYESSLYMPASLVMALNRTFCRKDVSGIFGNQKREMASPLATPLNRMKFAVKGHNSPTTTNEPPKFPLEAITENPRPSQTRPGVFTRPSWPCPSA